MAIFTAIAGAISSALFAGSVLATKIIAGALAFGTSLSVNYLTRPKARPYAATPSTAVQGQIEFGARVDAATMYGAGKVQGHRVFYAKWGAGNKSNATVDILANGWCDGLEPYVYFYGEKHDLVEDTIIGNEVRHYRIDGKGNSASIRFYDGRPGQGVDTKLVSDTASLGMSWKSTSICAGLCYVVIEREWSAEHFENGEPQFEWVLRGLREYDPRKDDTVVGGEGDHRLDDSSTWEHSLNPAVHRYNYQIGLRGLISNRVLIGEGKSSGQLDLGSYVAAMNACDAIREGKPTYQCSLWVTSDDDHTEILKEFDDAMCGYGMNRRGLSGIIAGAPQTPVMEITAYDIDLNRQKSMQRRKSAFELYNHFSGQFTSPEAHWNPESLDPIKVNQDVADDGRERQIANDFLQVTDADIAQYCLQIRYRQNRKGGAATIPVSRRAGFRVQEGNWITYLGLTWLVTNWSMDQKMQFTLTLAETGADVYSSGGIVPGPIVVPPTAPINPSVLSTVQDFDVEVGTIEGEDDTQVPALRFLWTPPSDPTIKTVRFEYFVGDVPVGDVFRDSTDDPQTGEYVTSKNVIGGVLYTARATITTTPDRFKTWTAYATTVLPTSSPVVSVELPPQYERLMQLVEEMGGRFRVLNGMVDELAGALLTDQALLEEYRGQINKGVASRFGDSIATAEFAMQGVTSLRNALAQIFVGVTAVTAAGTTESNMRFTALSDLDEGMLARFAIEVRATTAHDFAESGLELAVVDTPSGLQSVVIIKGDQIYLDVAGIRIPAFGLQRGDEARVTPLVYEPSDDVYTITVDLRQKHKTFTALLDDDADIRFPLGAWVGAEFTLIVAQESPGGNELTYDTGVFIVGSEFQQPSASPGVFSVYKGTVISLSPPVASLKLDLFGATTSSTEAVFSIDPPVDGKSIWNVITDGPLEIVGPAAGSADLVYTIIPLGIRFDGKFELWGAGGTSGSVFDGTLTIAHPAQPSDATFHDIVAGSGESTQSVVIANASFLSTPGGNKGVASGGDVNEDGEDGTTGSAGGVYVVTGDGGAAADGGDEQPGQTISSPSLVITCATAIPGNDPGAGANGPAYVNWSSNYRVTTGGGGGAAKVTKSYDEFDSLLQGVEYELVLPAPKVGTTSGSALTIGTPPNGAPGGRSKVRISALTP